MNTVTTMDISKELEDNQIVLLVIPSLDYSDDLVAISNRLAKNEGLVSYVTMNKTYGAVKESLKKEKADLSKFFFVDCITSTTPLPTPTTPKKDCVFAPSPNEIMPLDLILSGVITKTPKPTLMFFDSISTLSVYQNIGTIIKFMHGFTNKLRASNVKGVFVVLKKDLDPLLSKDIQLFVDKIVNLEPPQKG